MIDSFDNPVFKRLAHNDTGAAAGHVGGIVVPKDISEYFPPLPAHGSASNPTSEARLTAELYIEGRYIRTVSTRYQHQTWGGTRRPERRLTDNLGPIRNQAAAGDLMLFSKDLDNLNRMRITLVRSGTPEYLALERATGGRRWGVLSEAERPISHKDLRDAEEAVRDIAVGPATAFDSGRLRVTTRTERLTRNRAFRGLVLEQYGYRCAFTGLSFANPEAPGVYGLDAAHVVAVEASGSDHPANGLALTKDLHWAFDSGLIGVDSRRCIVVPDRVASAAGNQSLASLHGRPIREARDPGFRVLPAALDWHRTHRLLA